MSRMYPSLSPSRLIPLRKKLLDENAYATTILVIVMDVIGPEILQWHPSTIKAEVEESFSIKFPKYSFDRLMAAITVVTTDSFFKDLPAFVKLANILSGSEFDPAVVDLADTGECAWAVTEALLLTPPEVEQPFDEQIRAYVGAILEEEGDEKDFAYSDDPEFFSAIYKNQKSSADEIDNVVSAMLGELIQELQGIPLENGQTEDLVNNLKKELNSRKDENL